jgi:hypothetical protein
MMVLLRNEGSNQDDALLSSWMDSKDLAKEQQEDLIRPY